MIISPRNTALSNEFRKIVMERTECISDGEGVAMALLWGFLLDHARAHDLDVANLARDQLEDFIARMADSFSIVQQH